MITVYDFATVICFGCVVLTYFMFTEGGTTLIAHFLLPTAAFAIANQVGNAALHNGVVWMHALAVALILAGIGYTFLVIRHPPA
jgi:hypothetical protein